MNKLKKTSEKTLFITRAAIIAALYVALTLLSALFGLDSKVIQVRFSEALCVLPVYTVAAVPGVTVGCFIYNLFFGLSWLDTVFGTLATLLGALCTYYISFFRKHIKFAGIPTVIANSVIIPFVIVFSYMGGNLSALPFTVLTVALGEIISCCILGSLLLIALKRYRTILFGKDSYTGKSHKSYCIENTTSAKERNKK